METCAENIGRGYKSMKESTLWGWFSKFIRLRDSDKNGIGRCISCNKIIEVWRMDGKGEIHFNPLAHAGHYIGREAIFAGTKYDERNVNLQCASCNTYHEGNKSAYALALQRKYGPDILQILEVRKRGRMQKTRYAVTALTEYYKSKVKEMIKKGNG